MWDVCGRENVAMCGSHSEIEQGCANMAGRRGRARHKQSRDMGEEGALLPPARNPRRSPYDLSTPSRGLAARM